MPDKLYTTCTGKTIALSSIDAIGEVRRGGLEDDHYIIYSKSGKEIWITKGRDSRALETDRKQLVQEWGEYISDPQK